MADYTKLSELVNDTFTVEKTFGYQYKKWDVDSGRMLTSEKYEQGFRKIYTLQTDKGKLDVSASQLGSLLETVFKSGEANLINRTFEVKSNGKTGMDIRYFFSALWKDEAKTEEPNFNKFHDNKEALKARVSKQDDVVLDDIDEKPIDLSEIPF